jgi:hypothetical protein
MNVNTFLVKFSKFSIYDLLSSQSVHTFLYHRVLFSLQQLLLAVDHFFNFELASSCAFVALLDHSIK